MARQWAITVREFKEDASLTSATVIIDFHETDTTDAEFDLTITREIPINYESFHLPKELLRMVEAEKIKIIQYRKALDMAKAAFLGKTVRLG